MPNRVKVATLAKGADAAEQAIMEARRALSDQEDDSARAQRRSQRKRDRLESRYMPRGNG
ncbi:hypothetical protein [Actinomycetospora cinnamomea]|uniref:Uncharacterized protein n=1 Tax=Actinomycetospora cinnamomea TaxID=663609 RepID=A0A2U1FD92_9PSEU|nr:hypothetical protein [Actinomycetospora cinnamomea]PVZ10152.1 hypothetical protein C8D89_105229 [Actinomycetospora cinnamomea]